MPNSVCLRKDSLTSRLCQDFWVAGGGRYAIGIREATQLPEAFQCQQSSPSSIPSQLLGTEGHSTCPRAYIPSPMSIRNGKYNKKQWERLCAV